MKACTGSRDAQIFGACPAAPRPPPPPRPALPPRPRVEFRRDVERRRPLPANWTDDWLSARLRVLRGALMVLEESCIAPRSSNALPAGTPAAR